MIPDIARRDGAYALRHSRRLVAPCLRAVRTLTCLERNERMIMKSRTLTISVVALAGIATGAVLVKSVSFGESTNAGYSSAASSATASPAVQASGEYVFACVNKSGKIDYLEFRSPLPHQCWFSGETLWHFAALPAVEPTPTPTPTPTATPTPTPTVSAPAAAVRSASQSPSASASASSSATVTSRPGS